MVVREIQAERTGTGRLGYLASGPALCDAKMAAIFVHGPGDASLWRPVMLRLPEFVAAIAVDVRGRGSSAGLPGPFGVERNVGDLLALMDDLGIPSACLAGHSYGAFSVAAFVAGHPERVDGAILIAGGLDPLVSHDDEGLEDLLDQWEAEALALGSPDPLVVDPASVVAEAHDVVFNPDVRQGAVIGSSRTELIQPTDPHAAAQACATNPNLSVTIVPGHDEISLMRTPGGADALAESVRRLSGYRKAIKPPIT